MCVPSAIRGVELECVYPKDTSQASAYETRRTLRHVIFTAETHNFPTGQHDRHLFPCVFSLAGIIHLSITGLGVAPFSGATTGTGGRIRDVQSAGKGAHVIAGTAGYCFGNLHIPGLQK